MRAFFFCLLSVWAAPSGFEEIDRLYFHRHQGDNLGASISRLEERLKGDPSDAQALWRLGRSLVRRGERKSATAEKLAEFRRAMELIESSLSIDERSADANYWWGLAAGRYGQTRGMLRAMFLVRPIRKRMRRALELDPRRGGAHHVLGEMLRRIPVFAGGSKKGAVAELEEALRLSPNWTVNYTALAEAYLEVREKDKAKAVLKRAFEVREPDDPAEHEDNLADARRMLKELAEAP